MIFVTLLEKGEVVGYETTYIRSSAVTDFENVYIKQIADGGFLLTIENTKGTNQYYFSTASKLAKAVKELFTTETTPE